MHAESGYGEGFRTPARPGGWPHRRRPEPVTNYVIQRQIAAPETTRSPGLMSGCHETPPSVSITV